MHGQLAPAGFRPDRPAIVQVMASLIKPAFRIAPVFCRLWRGGGLSNGLKIWGIAFFRVLV